MKDKYEHLGKKHGEVGKKYRQVNLQVNKGNESWAKKKEKRDKRT